MTITGIFHIHTCFSFDSIMSYKRAVNFAVSKGLNFIVITDHDSVEGAKRAIDYHSTRYQTIPCEVVIGVEQSTDHGDIIGMFVHHTIDSFKTMDVVDGIKDQGGLVVLPHPFKNHILNDKLLDSVDLIEVYNSRVNCELNKKANELARHWNKPTLAGSDAHFHCELNNAICIFKEDDRINNLKNIFLSNEREFRTNMNAKDFTNFSQIIRALKKRNLGLFKKVLLKEIRERVAELNF